MRPPCAELGCTSSRMTKRRSSRCHRHYREHINRRDKTGSCAECAAPCKSDSRICGACAKPRRLVPCPKCGLEFWPWEHTDHARTFCLRCRPRRTRAELIERAAAKAAMRRERASGITQQERVAARREYDRLRAAEKYRTARDSERLRIQAYKRRHPEKNQEWNHTRRAREAAAYAEPVDIAAIKRSRKTCAYCASRITQQTAQVDHIVAIALGGSHTTANLVPCCRSCNAKKRDRTFSEWLPMVPLRRRTIVARLYERRHGAAWQLHLPLRSYPPGASGPCWSPETAGAVGAPFP